MASPTGWPNASAEIQHLPIDLSNHGQLRSPSPVKLRHTLFPCLALTCILAALPADSHARTVGDTQLRRAWEYSGLIFENNFSGARLHDVRNLGDNRFLLISRPEFRPINPSPWYAFKVTTEEERDIEVVLLMDSANDFSATFPPLHPSRPWLSHDGGTTWLRLEEDQWTREDFTGTASLSLPAGTTHVAAFRPYTLEEAMEWCDEWETLPFVSGSVVGLSAEGRPLRQFTIAETDAPRFLVLMGGQHPPEGDGDRGLVWFANELRADTPLA